MQYTKLIGVDFDGTIADTSSAKSQSFKSTFGADIPPYKCDKSSFKKELASLLGDAAQRDTVRVYLDAQAGNDMKGYLAAQGYTDYLEKINTALTDVFTKELTTETIKHHAETIYDGFRDFIYQHKGLANTSPVQGAHEALETLASEGVGLYLVTARPSGKDNPVLEAALWWLEQTGINKSLAGYFSSEVPDAELGRNLTKGEICQYKGFAGHIDDDERHLKEVQVPNLHRILIRIGAGKDAYMTGTSSVIDVPEMYEASSWDNIVKKVRSL